MFTYAVGMPHDNDDDEEDDNDEITILEIYLIILLQTYLPAWRIRLP